MRALALLVLVVAGAAFAEEAPLRRALALACEDAGAAALAQALDAHIETDEALAFGGVTLGWRRRLGLADGGLVVTRIAPFGTLRRVEVERRDTTPPRPEALLVAGPDCTPIAARRLRYGADGRAEAIEILGPDLAPVAVEPLDPPVPAGRDPGGVTVALVDSGVNYRLPAIAAALARDSDGRALGYDFWDLDPRPFDADPSRSPFFPRRHGTRVASVLLREGPAVRLIPYRYPRPAPARWAALIADAAAKGARIVVLPMGSRTRAPWGRVAEAVTAHPEVLFVVSAGNEGRDIDREPVYPASFRLANMLVVSSADGLGNPAPGANWGKSTVDLLVPGERIPVTRFDGSPGTASGASFAAPRLAALAARLALANPDWGTADLIAALIARARMTDAAGPPTSRYGFLDSGPLGTPGSSP